MRNDKLKHFIACAGITLTILLLFAFIPHRELYGWDKGIAVLAGWIIAAAKEIVWDKWLGRGQSDFYDFFWGGSGSVTAMFIWVIIDMI